LVGDDDEVVNGLILHEHFTLTIIDHSTGRKGINLLQHITFCGDEVFVAPNLYVKQLGHKDQANQDKQALDRIFPVEQIVH